MKTVKEVLSGLAMEYLARNVSFAQKLTITAQSLGDDLYADELRESSIRASVAKEYERECALYAAIEKQERQKLADALRRLMLLFVGGSNCWKN